MGTFTIGHVGICIVCKRLTATQSEILCAVCVRDLEQRAMVEKCKDKKCS